jgi:hypothetical protein
MDPAGARALARRIAEGKPVETLFDATSSELAPPSKADGVVYVRPALLRPAREIWRYVRLADGRLRRAR